MKLLKKLGQNLLIDKNILEKEVKAAEVSKKIVLEIGAGDGRLTEALLRAGAAKIYAVEKDERFAQILKEKFKGKETVAVFKEDFLKMGLPADVEIVVGNIPYYISSKIIFRLKDEKIKKAILMVQKEFAEKMIAKPNNKNYGRLSVTTQIFFDVKLLFNVPAHLFMPKPKVDSALVSLVPKGIWLSSKEEELIRKIFQQKNKKIRNIVTSAPKEWAEKRPRELKPVEVLMFVKDYTENYSENSSAS